MDSTRPAAIAPERGPSRPRRRRPDSASEAAPGRALGLRGTDDRTIRLSIEDAKRIGSSIL